MKIAISIPDGVFRRGEKLAKRLKKNRSQLYAAALAEYVERHDPDEITAAYNEVYANPDEELEAFVREGSRRTLEQVEW